MKTNQDNEKEQNLSVGNETTTPTSTPETEFVDNSPEAIEMRAYQKKVDNRPEAIQMQEYQDKINGVKKKNTTGIPDNIKDGIEKLSGISLDDVIVHYNSPKPAEIGAYAYAEGTDVYIAPGQEEHLPHELWHVIQQKQGKSKATKNVKGKKVDNRKSMESEAESKGNNALRSSKDQVEGTENVKMSDQNKVVQMAAWDSPSLGEETSMFVDPTKEEETLRLYYSMKYKAEQAYEVSPDYVGRAAFLDEGRGFQASFLPAEDRDLYWDLANWFEMQGGFRESAKNKEDIAFERHHILPRLTIRTFYAKLTDDQKGIVNGRLGEDRDKGDTLKIIQSLRSNLVMGPANRLDDPKENLDLFYTSSGELDEMSQVYSNVSDLMNRFNGSDESLEEILGIIEAAEAQVPRVRMQSIDWVFNDKVKNWEKRNKRG